MTSAPAEGIIGNVERQIKIPELILGCALANAFTHRFTKGFRVGLQMPCLLRVDGSKQPQVSALPERRVKKQKQTASTGYFKELARAPFFHVSSWDYPRFLLRLLELILRFRGYFVLLHWQLFYFFFRLLQAIDKREHLYYNTDG